MRKGRLWDAGLAFRLVLVSGAAFALFGCESVREAAGIEKTPPDEFAVVTKAPLVIPPDFNLRPPKPGAPPTNQSSPTDSAQAALFGSDDPAAIAAALPNTYSPEEKLVLAKTGAANASSGIRQQIAADARAMSTADPSFTDQLLFRSAPDPNAGHPVDADAEHDRLVAERTDGQTPIEGLTDSDKKHSQESATIGETNAPGTTESKDSGGWFSGIFDGIF